MYFRPRVLDRLFRGTHFDTFATKYPLHSLLTIPPYFRPISISEYQSIDVSELETINAAQHTCKITHVFPCDRCNVGTTPLQIAAAEARMDDIKVLLLHGANLQATDSRRDNALHYAVSFMDPYHLNTAVQRRRLDCVLVLLDAGIDVYQQRTIPDISGSPVDLNSTAFALFIEIGRFDMFEQRDSPTLLCMLVHGISGKCAPGIREIDFLRAPIKREMD